MSYIISTRPLGLLMLCLFFSGLASVRAQCPNDNNFERTLAAPQCGVEDTVHMGAGTYVEIPVLAGASYTFHTCGSGFDTHITGYQGNLTNSVFANDDNGPECPGVQSSVNWTSTFTGILRVLVDLSDCDSCKALHDSLTTGSWIPTDCPSFGSAVLHYRQNNNLSITSSDAPMCDGQTRALLATPPGGTFSGMGVSGSVFSAPYDTSGYYIMYNYGACLDTQFIASQNPIVSIVGDSAYCNGGSVLLSANAIPGTGTAIANYQWKKDGNNVGINFPTLTASQPGTYSVEVTNSNGCTDESPGFIVSENQNPVVTTFADTSLCQGDTIKVMANVTAGSGTIASYQWMHNGINTGGDSASLTITQAGNYSLEVTNSAGCSGASNLFSVTVNPNPVVFVNSTNLSCNGFEDGSATATVLSGTPPFSYLWNEGSMDSTLTDLMAGTYKLTITDGNGCSASSNAVNITEPPVLILAVTDSMDASCKRKNGSFTLSASGGVGPYQYSINGGTFNPTGIFDHVTANTYAAIVRDARGCQTTTSVEIENIGVYPDPTITAFPGTAFCPGDSILLHALSGADEYLWSNGATTDSIWVHNGGDYNITVTNANTCIDTGSASVTVFDTVVAVAGNDTTIFVGFSAPLLATGGDAYIWNNEESLSDALSSAPIATPLTTTTYRVTVTSFDGCKDVDSVTVTVDNEISPSSFNPPNLFTPNGDGHNDTWIIRNIEYYDECEVSIFNRWGTEIFNTKNYQNDWDGSYNGKEVADGTYYYVIGCGETVFKGSVTILR